MLYDCNSFQILSLMSFFFLVLLKLDESQSHTSWKRAGSSSFGNHKQKTWNKCDRRMQEEYEEEMERVVGFSSLLFIHFLLKLSLVKYFIRLVILGVKM